MAWNICSRHFGQNEFRLQFMQKPRMTRTNIKHLIDIPNVGKATAADLATIGISQPGDLIGCDPYQMYAALCEVTGKRQDPCMMDVFISAVRYMEGGPARKWWEFTPERKARLNKHNQ